MKNRYKHISQQILPYQVLFFLTVTLYLFAPSRVGDDGWFISMFLTNYEGNLIEFLRYRYETWSTRLLLEAYTLLLIYVPVLYSISMPLWLTAIAAGFYRLLDRKELSVKWLIGGSLLLLPVSFNADAGYACSTVNYVFAFGCLLWAVVPIVECQRGKHVPVFAYIGSCILMVLGCNMEYYCPPFLIYGIYLLIRGIKLRKGRIFSVLVVLFAIGGLIYAFSAPASTVSAYNETNSNFLGYELLTTLDKLQVAFVATAGGLVSQGKNGNHFFLPTLLFGILLLLFGMEKKVSLLSRIVCGVPLFVTLLTGGIARFLPEGNVWRVWFFCEDSGWKWDSSFTLVVAFLFFGAIVFGLFRIDKRLGWSGLLALFCRTTMAASSSVFSSGLRTFYPLFFVLCISIAVLVFQIEKKKKPAITIFCIAMVVSYGANLCYCFYK